MNPEYRPPGTEPAEPTPKQELIQSAVIHVLTKNNSTSKWGIEVLQELAQDYVSAFTQIDQTCSGLWRDLRIVSNETRHPATRALRVETLVVKKGEIQNPLFRVEGISEKEYLAEIKDATKYVRITFGKAFSMISENKTPEELIRLRNMKESRHGFKNVGKGSRYTHGNHMADR